VQYRRRMRAKGKVMERRRQARQARTWRKIKIKRKCANSNIDMPVGKMVELPEEVGE